MKKNMILAVCIAAACAAFAGCGNASETDNLSLQTETTAAETTAETTEAVTTAETTVSTAPETTAETTAETTEVSETVTSETEQTEEEKHEEKPAENQETPSDTGNSGENSNPSEENPSEGKFEEDDLVFTFDGSSVKLGEDISAFVAAVKPVSESSSKSCLGSGDDYMYEYEHFSLTGYSENGSNICVAVDFTDEEVSTPKNIKKGSSKDDVIKAYGTPSEESDRELTYIIGKASLVFRMSGDTVKGVSYNFDLM